MVSNKNITTSTSSTNDDNKYHQYLHCDCKEFSIIIKENLDDLKERIKDGRLFPSYPLYCEGLHRPVLRGSFHLLCTIILPFGLWHLFLEANGSLKGQIVGSLYVLTNIFCYGMSALYHVGRWSVQTEILLQKLDHCGIALLSTGTILPTALLLLDRGLGIVLALIAVALCAIASLRIFQRKPSILMQIIVACNFLPFLPWMLSRYNTIEFYFWLTCCTCQIIGVAIFVSEAPRLYPNWFGYHELFHLFVVLAGFCVYVVNWSIIRRTCNPYAHHIDVFESVSSYFYNIS